MDEKKYSKEEVRALILKAISEGNWKDLFREEWVDDGDGHIDFIGINVDEKNLDKWFSENLK